MERSYPALSQKEQVVLVVLYQAEQVDKTFESTAQLLKAATSMLKQAGSAARGVQFTVLHQLRNQGLIGQTAPLTAQKRPFVLTDTGRTRAASLAATSNVSPSQKPETPPRTAAHRRSPAPDAFDMAQALEATHALPGLIKAFGEHVEFFGAHVKTIKELTRAVQDLCEQCAQLKTEHRIDAEIRQVLHTVLGTLSNQQQVDDSSSRNGSSVFQYEKEIS